MTCTCVKAKDNYVKLNKLSSALFIMNNNDTDNNTNKSNNNDVIEIIDFIGNQYWIGIGHVINDKCFVFKEELLYLMECGCCELIIQYKLNNEKILQTCIGLENAFTLFFSLENNLSFNFNIYSVFKKLKLMDYIIKRRQLFNNNNSNNEWNNNNYLNSKQSELSKYFELNMYWLWKKKDDPFWKVFNQSFKNNNIKSIASSFKKLYLGKPDSLLLIKKNDIENKNSVNLINSIISSSDNSITSIIVANASQNDVLLFKFDSININVC